MGGAGGRAEGSPGLLGLPDHVFTGAPVLEEFHIHGPNGKPICIVSDVVVGPDANPLAEAYRNHRPHGLVSRWVLLQLLLAVGYLHEAGVVHRITISGIWCFEQSLIDELLADPPRVDIHPRNVLIRLPG